MAKSRLVLLVLLLAVCAAPARADYFPLQVGNQWVYRVGSFLALNTFTMEIVEAGEFDGRTYYRLQGWTNRDFWLRADETGRVLAYDPESRQESVWYAFQNPEGETYPTSIPSCCGRAVIASRAANYAGPVGEFNTALEVRYPGVFQVGIYRELFLDGVGLLRREEGLGGPAVAIYDLIYARAGNTVITGPEVGFSLALDRYEYASGAQAPRATARFTLRNAQANPITLVFPTTQIYDLTVRNDQGVVVFRWSDGRAFAEVITERRFGPGEKNFSLIVPLADSGGKTFPDGKYVAEAWLTTLGGRAFAASVGFEIRAAK